MRIFFKLGSDIKLALGFDWVYLDAAHSKNLLDLYAETIKLTNTYYKAIPNV